MWLLLKSKSVNILSHLDLPFYGIIYWKLWQRLDWVVLICEMRKGFRVLVFFVWIILLIFTELLLFLPRHRICISLTTFFARTLAVCWWMSRINLSVLAFIRLTRNGLDCSEEVAILISIESTVLSWRLNGNSHESRLVFLVIFVPLSSLLEDAVCVYATLRHVYILIIFVLFACIVTII